jgi:hypothetical protein
MLSITPIYGVLQRKCHRPARQRSTSWRTTRSHPQVQYATRTVHIGNQICRQVAFRLNMCEAARQIKAPARVISRNRCHENGTKLLSSIPQPTHPSPPRKQVRRRNRGKHGTSRCCKRDCIATSRDATHHGTTQQMSQRCNVTQWRHHNTTRTTI